MNPILFYVTIVVFATTSLQAQTRICNYYVPFSGYSDSLFLGLEKAETGQCYSKCFIGSEYETFSDSNFTVTNPVSIIKDRTVKITPPIIDEVTDSIVLKKTVSKWSINAAVKPPKGVRILAPVYRDSLVRIVVQKDSLKWFRKKSHPCLSQSPDDCLVFLYARMPAQYNTLHNLKQIKPPRKIVGQDTIALNAAELAKYGAIETEYEQIIYYHEVLKQVGRVEFPVANKTKYISHIQKLARIGVVGDWKQIFCSDDGMHYRRQSIALLQKALKERGYYKGKIDNVLGAATNAALIKFQKDNGFPSHSDAQVMKKLGVEW